jgi:hypothetical protein
MAHRQRKRRRRKNPSLGDIDTTVELLAVGAVIFIVVYYGNELVSFIESLFKAPIQAIGEGVEAETNALTANTDATGDPVLDSLGVGAAGGG